MNEKSKVTNIILKELEDGFRYELKDTVAIRNLEDTVAMRYIREMKNSTFSWRADMNGVTYFKVEITRQMFGKRKIVLWTKSYINTVTLNRTEWNMFMNTANEMLSRFYERYAEKIARNAN
jgi:hypothetical protein